MCRLGRFAFAGNLRRMNLHSERGSVPVLLCRDALYRLMRNEPRRTNGAILGSGIKVISETWPGWGGPTALPMADANVANDCDSRSDQGEEARNRDGENNLHHEKDIKGESVRASYSFDHVYCDHLRKKKQLSGR